MKEPKRILTIDDDQDVNLLIKAFLKNTEYELEICTTAKDFFEKVVTFKPHLCLVDLNIEEHSGFGFKIIDLMRKKIGKDVTLIVMSRRSADQDIEEALRCGANDYIQKPLDKALLISKLNIFLGDKSDVKFPFYGIPTSERECTYDIDIEIYRVSEKEVRLSSPSFIAKGTLVKLYGELFAGRFYTIQETVKDNATGTYLATIELDDTRDIDLKTKIRKLLIQTPPIG
jgi:DNA-binding response OmpR family regulator